MGSTAVLNCPLALPPVPGWLSLRFFRRLCCTALVLLLLLGVGILHLLLLLQGLVFGCRGFRLRLVVGSVLGRRFSSLGFLNRGPVDVVGNRRVEGLS